jgi:hypothetical protein
MCGRMKMCLCTCVHNIFWKLEEHHFKGAKGRRCEGCALKATVYKSIEYGESKFENFVGRTQKKLLMTSVEDFGGARVS